MAPLPPAMDRHGHLSLSQPGDLKGSDPSDLHRGADLRPGPRHVLKCHSAPEGRGAVPCSRVAGLWTPSGSDPPGSARSSRPVSDGRSVRRGSGRVQPMAFPRPQNEGPWGSQVPGASCGSGYSAAHRGGSAPRSPALLPGRWGARPPRPACGSRCSSPRSQPPPAPHPCGLLASLSSHTVPQDSRLSQRRGRWGSHPPLSLFSILNGAWKAEAAPTGSVQPVSRDQRPRV